LADRRLLPQQLYIAKRPSRMRSTLVSADVNGFQIEYKRADKRSAISQGIPIGIPTKNQNQY
jgi:hypothetical protein